MIARLEVTRGTLTEYPLAEKVHGGWQNGVTFYPDAEVTKVTPLFVRTACICTPAIAGISDGPSIDCPQHGEPQGEPTGATIVDMLTAFYGEERDGWSMGKVRRMRAALTVAYETKGEGR